MAKMMGRLTALNNCDRDYLPTKQSRRTEKQDALASWWEDWGDDQDYSHDRA